MEVSATEFNNLKMIPICWLKYFDSSKVTVTSEKCLATISHLPLIEEKHLSKCLFVNTSMKETVCLLTLIKNEI